MNKTDAIKHAQLLARQHPIGPERRSTSNMFVVYYCDDYETHKIMRLDDYYNLNTVNELDVKAIVGYFNSQPRIPSPINNRDILERINRNDRR